MNKRLRHLVIMGSTLAAGIAGTLAVQSVRAAGVPKAAALTYSGTLAMHDGKAVDGSRNIGLSIFDAQSNGTSVCQVMSGPISVSEGHFQIALPEPCAAAAKANADLWVDVQVEGASVGRTKLGAVPYALESGHATSTDMATQAQKAASGGEIASTIASLQSELKVLQQKALTNVQSGSVTVDTVNYPPPAGCEGLKDPKASKRSCPFVVTFATPFQQPPVVSAGIMALDESTTDTDTRVSVSVGGVTTTGFTVTMATWASANILNAAV
ncbi:MAG TPA: H-type lectin domain-containing protein, partial [Polyangiaceae bacterium]|nr:H-type lectin domain-containing protein [Polyangiaceae bacterium]